MMTKTKQTVADRIRHLLPCGDALEWAENYSSPAKAWRECERGDWMLWLLGSQIKSEPWADDQKPLVACAVACALTVKHLWPAKQKEEISAGVEIILAWTKGRATTEQAKEVRRKLYAAAGYGWDELAHPTQEAWRDLARRVMKQFVNKAGG